MSPGLRSLRPKPTLLLGGSRGGVRLGGLETLIGGKGFSVVDLVVVVVVLVVVVVVVSGPHVRSENEMRCEPNVLPNYL